MRVLGIDPGSLTTGYGVVERGTGGRLLHVSDGAISPGGALALPERLLRISEALEAVMSAYSPDAVSIESVFFAKNVKSAIQLGHARGAALVAAARFKLPVFEYAPMSIKLAVTGHGAATKDQVKKMVKLLLKTSHEPVKSDASDALAIAICHIHHGAQGPRAEAARR